MPTYIINGENPSSHTERVLSDIILTVNSMLCEGLKTPGNDLVNIHPKTLISMVITNILVHFLTGAIRDNNPLPERLKMLDETLDEVCLMSTKLWNALEAYKADDTIAH